jgi:hypothetical protein
VANWTQTDADALSAAVATGVLRVHYSGPPERDVTYASLEAMRALLASMNQYLAYTNNPDPFVGAQTYRLIKTKKGV